MNKQNRPGKKDARLAMRIPASLRDALFEISVLGGVNLSQIIRLALMEFVRQHNESRGGK
jgi:hypothetical protein